MHQALRRFLASKYLHKPLAEAHKQRYRVVRITVVILALSMNARGNGSVFDKTTDLRYSKSVMTSKFLSPSSSYTNFLTVIISSTVHYLHDFWASQLLPFATGVLPNLSVSQNSRYVSKERDNWRRGYFVQVVFPASPKHSREQHDAEGNDNAQEPHFNPFNECRSALLFLIRLTKMKDARGPEL